MQGVKLPKPPFVPLRWKRRYFTDAPYPRRGADFSLVDANCWAIASWHQFCSLFIPTRCLWLQAYFCRDVKRKESCFRLRLFQPFRKNLRESIAEGSDEALKSLWGDIRGLATWDCVCPPDVGHWSKGDQAWPAWQPKHSICRHWFGKDGGNLGSLSFSLCSARLDSTHPIVQEMPAACLSYLKAPWWKWPFLPQMQLTDPATHESQMLKLTRAR